MTTVFAPAESLLRARVRGTLLATLEKETLLTRLRVAPEGRVLIETTEWDSYWEPLRDLDYQGMEAALEALYSAWRNYIASRFASSLRQEFCFRYFRLLDTLLSCTPSLARPRWAQAFQRVLGFECFAILSATSDSEVLAAGTSTLRNPCYLLAKLKAPNALDDPQFLPIITLAGLGNSGRFYCYRQYHLSQDSPMSLLLYVTASEATRSSSFKLVNCLISGVSAAIDPRTRQRAQRLCQGVIRPMIEEETRSQSQTLTVEIVDVGAGSGSLAACLCRQVHGLGVMMGLSLRFRLWSVDLDPSDPARFLRDKRGRSLVDSLMFVGDDYRDWLSEPQPIPSKHGLRIALVSKLFNNLSRFSVRRLSPQEVPPSYCDEVWSSNPGEHSPVRVLAPGGNGVEALMVSHSRVALQAGRTYVQTSLSPLYRGLWLSLSDEVGGTSSEDDIFLPVRTFNPDCLVTRDGASVISRLVKLCDYVVIEDADLAPKDLTAHLATFSLSTVTVQDVTRALGLTGNYAYVISSRAEGIGARLQGERIW